MFAVLIRWICAHPYQYTILTSVPYLAAAVAPVTPGILIVILWTAVRVAVVLPARQQHTQSAEQEAYNDGANEAIDEINRRRRVRATPPAKF